MAFKPIVFLIFLSPAYLWAQILDSFDDGDFTNNPTWTGADPFFLVDAGVLRSNAPGPSNYYLSTSQNLMDDTRWEFFINLNFSTSGSNFVEVFLTADNADLNAVQNGYFLRFGGTPDEISFFRKTAGANLLLIDGVDGTTGSSANNDFLIRVDRTAAGEWIIDYAPNAAEPYLGLGVITDLELISTSHFGFRIVQSSAAGPIGNHFFDDFSVNLIPVDNTPPVVIGAEAFSVNSVNLGFSEPMDEGSANDVQKYSISPVLGNPVSASYNPIFNTVALGFNGNFENGVTYELSILGVADLAGNISELQTFPISFISPGVAAFRGVVINELMADPAPSQGLPEAEYIELFNVSNEYFQLANWKLVNTTVEKVLPNYLLEPGGFVLLCNSTNADLLSTFGPVISITSFTALTNSGDSLTLINSSGVVIDIVAYTSAWYGNSEFVDGGYALEQINPFTPCTGRENWSASNGQMGGTPGAVNAIFNDAPDLAPPYIVSYQLTGDATVELVFSEPMDASSLANGAYAIDPEIAVLSVEIIPDLRSIMLEFGEPLLAGIDYQISVSGITDCVGNTIEATVLPVLFGAAPLPGELVFSEIYPDPNPSIGLPEFEYIEVFNVGNRSLSLAGVQVNDKTLAGTDVLVPGAYALLLDPAALVAFTGFPGIRYTSTFSSSYLTNAGRELVLSSPSGVILDRVAYDLSWYGSGEFDDGGYSIERRNILEPCRGRENWGAGTADIGGTPGSQNALYTEDFDQEPPLLLSAAVIDPNTIELLLSEQCDSLSLSLAEIAIDPFIALASRVISPNQLDRLQLILADPLLVNTFYTMQISGVLDCSLNGSAEPMTVEFGIPDTALAGDFLINEVLFNPRTGGVDFVELVNTSEKILNLQNWFLQNQDGSTRAIATEVLPVNPGAYIVLASNPTNINQEYPFGQPENFHQMESLPAYNNESGSVRLLNPTAEVMDLFDYSDDYHFALLNSFKGVSLERISWTIPTNSSFNWTSASQSEGFATPGKRNSQYNPEGVASAQFQLVKEVFSPDNDGFEDVLRINYRLQGSDYLATVTIYDRRGRKIRSVMNNFLLSTEGTITWDGIDDRGSKARIGPHIVFVEIFNPSGNTEAFKLPCVVAGRF